MALDSTSKNNIKRFSSGILSLDMALGGGFPEGRIVEIQGLESSGKTTITLTTIANVQKNKGVCAFIDAENAIDIEYAKNLGVDLKRLILSQTSEGEKAFDIMYSLIDSGEVSLIVVDSVASLVPKTELEGDFSQSNMGLHARLMSKACRKLVELLNKKKTTIIFINQIRQKIGIMFGNPETTTGGNALKFYSSVRLDVRGKKLEDKNKNAFATQTTVKVIKNKVAPPFKIAEFQIEYGKGVSKENDLINIGEKLGIIQKNGAFYKFDNKNIGQGIENSKETIIKDKELYKKIESEIHKFI
jgi:recombination protein RecA